MALNYSELQSIYRSEKTSSSLHKVSKNFYSEVVELVSKLEPEYRDSTLKLAEEIYSLRMGKITRLISRKGEAPPPANMTEVEKEMYEELASTISRYRERIIGREEKEKPKKKEKGKKVEDGKVSVRIIAPIPAIIGSDMTHYGPFKEDEEVRLPEATAKILIEQGVAEEV